MPSANAHWYKLGEALLVLSQGDITTWSGDALVNAGTWTAYLLRSILIHLLNSLRNHVTFCLAANERMLGGGGVDGGEQFVRGPLLHVHWAKTSILRSVHLRGLMNETSATMQPFTEQQAPS